MNDPFGDARLSNTADGPGEIRIWPIALTIAGVFALFVIRLFQLQILEGDDLASRSQANSVRTVRLEAQRGSIVDREGRTIAASRPAIRVDLIPHEIQTPWRTYSALGSILGRDPREIADEVGDPRGRRRFQAVSLSKDLAPREGAQIDSHRYAMPGVVLSRRPLREYVHGPLASQLLGTLGEIGADELSQEDFVGYRSGETIGKTGLESAHEAISAGAMAASISSSTWRAARSPSSVESSPRRAVVSS